MTNAPEPMTGGRSWPPREALFSTAPATWGRKPTFFMSGMVKVPVETTFAMLLPEIEPNMAEAMTATLAGPPTVRPASAMGISMKNLPIPD